MNAKAWAVFSDDGNIRLWSTDCEAVRKFAESNGLTLVPLYSMDHAPVAFIDTRPGLGVCAFREEDFAALYALKGRRVALIDIGPVNV